MNLPSTIPEFWITALLKKRLLICLSIPLPIHGTHHRYQGQ